MPDAPDQTPDSTENAPEGGTQDAPPTDDVTTDDDQTPEEGAPVGDMFPRSYVEQLRTEAAANRVKANELETKLADAKTPEQVAEIVAEIKAENERLTREALVKDVASEFKLPAALAKRLVGKDEAELKADAAELAKLIPAPDEIDEPEILLGGLTPGSVGDVASSPREVLARARNRKT